MAPFGASGEREEADTLRKRFISLAVVWDKSEGAHLSHGFGGKQDAWLKHSLLLLDDYVGWNSSLFCSFFHYILSIFREDLGLNSSSLQRAGRFQSQSEQQLGQQVQQKNIHLNTAKPASSGVSTFPWPSCFTGGLDTGRRKKDLPRYLDKFNGTTGSKTACVHSPCSFPYEMSYLHW